MFFYRYFDGGKLLVEEGRVLFDRDGLCKRDRGTKAETQQAARQERIRAAGAAGDIEGGKKSSAKRIAVGWKLDGEQRSWLLNLFSSAYPDVIANHVTLSSGTERNGHPRTPARKSSARWTTAPACRRLSCGSMERPVVRREHVSHHVVDRPLQGSKARDSNDVIRTLGWQSLEQPIPITLKGASWASEP